MPGTALLDALFNSHCESSGEVFAADKFFFFSAAPAVYGGSQARGQIGATTAGLHHSYNIRAKPHLRPTPKLTATPDP